MNPVKINLINTIFSKDISKIFDFMMHLPQIISDIRNKIMDCGGEVHFNKKLTDFIIDNNSIKGIKYNRFYWQSLIIN
jgi:hypothetical protein